MGKALLVLLFTLHSIACWPQQLSFEQERPFLNHLDSLNLPDEKTAYLEYLNQDLFLQNNDTLKLEIAHAYFVSDNFEKALQSFLLINIFKDNGNIKREFGFCLLKNKKYSQYLECTHEWQDSNDSVLIIQKLTASVLANPENENARMALRNIIPVQIPEKDLHSKSPLLAGIFSAVVPGSGKLYCGKKHQFVTSLLANAAFGIQAYEAGIKGGTGSARFIVSGILFSIFYIGNIWGSVLEAKSHQLEKYKQFEYEVLDYNRMLVYQQ